jgi:type I restriction enzyme M protein
MKTISSFKAIFEKAAYGGSYHTVFDDFLTICICCFSINPATGNSFYEEEYLRIIEPYKARKTLDYFPELLAELIIFMEENRDNSQGNDLLGDFFQQEITHGRNGQFFTPLHVCTMMAQMNSVEETRSMNVLDPCCGSGRMLVAFGLQSKISHRYYGIDIDPMCVKMTVINLFLNGFQGEVMCADALFPDDFRFGYSLLHFPFGIFKVETKEESMLWKINQNSFSKKQEHEPEKPQTLQLQLF